MTASCKTGPTAEPQASARPDAALNGDLDTTSPRGQVIVFWYAHADGKEAPLLELIDDFNADNDWNITVIGEYGGSTGSVYDWISTRENEQRQDGIEARELPQIVTAERHQTAAYAARGVLVEPAPYVESERWGYTEEEINDILPLAPITGTVRPAGGHGGWQVCEQIDVLYYNADWLAGLGYTEGPRTWEAFEEIACAASDPNLGTYGYEFSPDASTFAGLLLNREGHLFDAEKDSYAFDGETGIELVTTIQRLLEEGCAVMQTERAGDRNDFAASKVLFTIGSTSELEDYGNSVAEGAGFDWSVAPLPTTLETPSMHAHGPELVMLRSTPQRQLAAWLFLRWLTEPEQQARWAQATTSLPVRARAAELLQNTFATNPHLEEAFDLLQHGVTREPTVAGYDECRDVIREMLVAVGHLANAESQLTEAVAACNASRIE
jgi:multiple sugar transport system substrate-binding protein/sn-glycerol 3-phosphate transport system substrate-binding protein